MQALAARKLGDFREVLSLQEVEPCRGELGPNEILVRVAYADVNPVDLQKLHGGRRAGTEVDPPFVPGFSGSGKVEKSDCKAFPVGSRVCFLLNPSSNGSGSYAQFCIVDIRAAAIVPDTISLKEAGTVPLAGCTAYEALHKLGLLSSSQQQYDNTRRLLIVGGAGGVGSWACRLARAKHPQLEIICTASSNASKEWCRRENGASRCLAHDAIEEQLDGGPKGSVDAILCLTEPKGPLLKALSEVIRPYGKLCLVVAGPSIQTMDLGFFFFKSATISTETVFSSFRTNFVEYQPSQEIGYILDGMVSGSIKAPICPYLDRLETGMELAAHPVGGVLAALEKGHVQGKLCLEIDKGAYFQD